jgi:hypothetical protein
MLAGSSSSASALAASWGPDDLSERLRITARLQDVAAHVDDVRTRMDAHLWRLTTALETLDVTGMHRQLSALDLLAGETGSPLVRYFAMTRRAMHATLAGDLGRARELAEAAYALGTDTGIPDAFAVYHEQRAEIARHADDAGFLAGEAALAEDYAVRHGVESLMAEAAVLAVQAGDTERASRLVAQVAGGGFGQVRYDVDWLLTVSKTTEAAAGLGYTDIARAGMTLMAPYAGRCVLNAGAVVCVGVVEDYLWRAAVVSADPRADDWRAAAGAAYRRLGAPWWLRRVSAPYDVRRGAPAAASRPADRRTPLEVTGSAAMRRHHRTTTRRNRWTRTALQSSPVGYWPTPPPPRWYWPRLATGQGCSRTWPSTARGPAGNWPAGPGCPSGTCGNGWPACSPPGT